MFTKTDIEKYFLAEKTAGLLFMIIGIAAVVSGIVFFSFIKTSFYRGGALPLILIGMLAGIIGFTVHKRSDEDRARNVYAYDMNPNQLKEKEIPRMEKVMKNFTIYTYAEIALVLIGAGLFFYNRYSGANDFWKGFGIMLAIMALLALAADYFAMRRGGAYLTGMKEWVGKMK